MFDHLERIDASRPLWSVPTLKSLCIEKSTFYLRNKKNTFNIINANLPANLNNLLFAKVNKNRKQLRTKQFEGVEITEVDMAGKNLSARVSSFLKGLKLTKLKIGDNRDEGSDIECEDEVDDDEDSPYDSYRREDEDGPDPPTRIRRFLKAAFSSQTRQSLRVLEFVKTSEVRKFFTGVDELLSFFPNLDSFTFHSAEQEEMKKIVGKRRKWKNLSLASESESYRGSLDIDDLCKNFPSLETLRLRKVRLDGPIQKLFCLKNLQILDVSKCFEPQQIDTFLKADLPTNHRSQLHTLEWSFNKSTKKVLKKLLEYTPNLKAIGLVDCPVPAKNFAPESMRVFNTETIDSTLLALENYSRMEDDTIYPKLMEKMQKLPKKVLKDERLNLIVVEMLRQLERLLKSYMSKKMSKTEPAEDCIAVLKAIWTWYNDKSDIQDVCPFSSAQTVTMFSMLTYAFKISCGRVAALEVLSIPNVFYTIGVDMITLLNNMHVCSRRYMSSRTAQGEDELIVPLSQAIMEWCLEHERQINLDTFDTNYMMTLVTALRIYHAPFTDELATFVRIFLEFARRFLPASKFEPEAEEDLTILYRNATDEPLKAEIIRFVHFFRNAPEREDESTEYRRVPAARNRKNSPWLYTIWH